MPSTSNESSTLDVTSRSLVGVTVSHVQGGAQLPAYTDADELVPREPVSHVLFTRADAEQVVQSIEATAQRQHESGVKPAVMALWRDDELLLAFQVGDERTHRRVRPDGTGLYEITGPGLTWRWHSERPSAEVPEDRPDDPLIGVPVTYLDQHGQTAVGIVVRSFLGPQAGGTRQAMLYLRDHHGRHQRRPRADVDVVRTRAAARLADQLHQHALQAGHLTPADINLVHEIADALDPALPAGLHSGLLERAHRLANGVHDRSAWCETLRDVLGYLTVHAR